MLKGLRIEIRKELVEAIKDYKYLLNRNYSMKNSLEIVVKRYLLNSIERMILYRCVHSEDIVKQIVKKIVDSYGVKGEILLIDGFNVLITVDTAFSGGHVFLSDDSLLRDVSKSIRKFSFNKDKHGKELELIIKEAHALQPSKIIFFYDKQVSYSGEIASLTRKIGEKMGCNIETIVSDRNDKTLITYSEKGVVSSSDIVVLLKAKKVFDLAKHIIAKWRPENIIDIMSLSKN